MPPIPGMVHWHHYIGRSAKMLKNAYQKASRGVDASIHASPAKLEPILVRNTPKQPLHPLARIKQTQSRWYSTARASIDGGVRRFTTAAGKSGLKYDRASFPKSRIATSISQSAGRAPFASTLRPNLTGGTLGRTAGGYALGGGRAGGARYFSRGPASQAQVVQNVSQAVRAFFVSGQKAQFDGVSARTGEKRYKAVSTLQDSTGRKLRDIPRMTPGSTLDFAVNPTITALTPLNTIPGYTTSSHPPTDHLNTSGLIDVLTTDFSRALKDLTAILSDLQRLAALGDLPITYENSTLRVHFPGCDDSTVESVCAELGVVRGTVSQDKAFDSFAGTEMALLFPCAPSAASEDEDEDCGGLFDSPPAAALPRGHAAYVQSLSDLTWEAASDAAYSTLSARSDSDSELELEDVLAADPWLSSPSLSGYGSGRSKSGSAASQGAPLEYQGFEGICRFIGELDAVRR